MNISVDTDKSGEKQMMKWRAFAGNIWHNWFKNYIPDPIKTMGGVN